MAGLTPAHLILILVIALVVIGPGKLPEVGSAIGKSVREFQKATGQVHDPEPAAPAPAQPAVQPVMMQAPPQVYVAAPPLYGNPQYPAYPQPAPEAAPAPAAQPVLEPHPAEPGQD